MKPRKRQDVRTCCGLLRKCAGRLREAYTLIERGESPKAYYDYPDDRVGQYELIDAADVCTIVWCALVEKKFATVDEHECVTLATHADQDAAIEGILAEGRW